MDAVLIYDQFRMGPRHRQPRVVRTASSDLYCQAGGGATSFLSIPQSPTIAPAWPRYLAGLESPIPPPPPPLPALLSWPASRSRLTRSASSLRASAPGAP